MNCEFINKSRVVVVSHVHFKGFFEKCAANKKKKTTKFDFIVGLSYEKYEGKHKTSRKLTGVEFDSLK